MHIPLYFDQVYVASMISALVPPQGEKVVNYPTRPVDTTTDFEGTTSLQPSQPVYSHMAYNCRLCFSKTANLCIKIQFEFHLLKMEAQIE